MDKYEFDRLFTALYFALAAHAADSGLVLTGGKAFADDGYGTIKAGEHAILTVETADLEAFRDASNLEQQVVLDGLVAQLAVVTT